MKLKNLHETESNDAAQRYRILVASYLDDHLRKELYHLPSTRSIDSAGIFVRVKSEVSSAMVYIVIHNDGSVVLTYYPGELNHGCEVERVNLYDPDSLQKIGEFVNKFDYSAE